jgi:hypothetical protein
MLRVGGQSEITFATIDWTPFITGDPYNGTGNVLVAAPASGVFAPLTTGTIGAIVDRDGVGITVPPQPVGVPILVPNWMTFAALPGIALDLTFIVPGTFPAARCGPPAGVGDTCTPPAPPPFISPYNFSNFLDAAGRLSSNASFSVSGTVRNTSTGEPAGEFSAVFGLRFFGKPLEQVLNQIVAPSGSVVGSYSGTIVATDIAIRKPSVTAAADVAIPEPSAFVLVALGTVLLAARRRYSHS